MRATTARTVRVVAGLLVCLLVPAVAFAHNVVAAAYVVGATIEGEVGFSNGDMAVGATVNVDSGDGERLGNVVTDADGYFVFEATRRVDHVLRINLGAGHVAELTIAAADLPATLPDAEGVIGVAEATAPRTPAATLVASSSPDAAELERMIREAVAAQVRPLQKQLLEYENKVRLHDILGGLGYILGLSGLGLYLLARRKSKPSELKDGEPR